MPTRQRDGTTLVGVRQPRTDEVPAAVLASGTLSIEGVNANFLSALSGMNAGLRRGPWSEVTFGSWRLMTSDV